MKVEKFGFCDRMKYSLAFRNKNSRRKRVIEGYVYEHK